MKQEISVIVALTQTGVIGKNNQLPWHLPNDLKRFRALTTGHPIIMGRKTFDSIGKPLPNRRNVVISRNADLSLPSGVELCRSLTDALSLLKDAPKIFVIGGSQIIQEALPFVNKLYLTWIDAPFEGDVIFPKLGTFLNGYKIDSEEKFSEPFAHRYVNYSKGLSSTSTSN